MCTFLYIKKVWWRAFDKPKKNHVNSRGKNNMAAATNFFVPKAEEFFLNTLSVFYQCTACLDLRDGDQAQFLSRTAWGNGTSDVSTHNWNTSWSRGVQERHRPTYISPCLSQDITGFNLCKAPMIRCLCIIHPLDCRAPRIKPIPDWGAEVRISLTKSSKEASEIWLKLLQWPRDMPNSWRRRNRVLEETPGILAISVYLNHTLSLNSWICSTEIREASLPTSPDWVGDEIPVFGPVALSTNSLFSLLLQYRLSSPSLIRLRACISSSVPLLRTSWSGRVSVTRRYITRTVSSYCSR